jgi:hypothetical protein
VNEPQGKKMWKNGPRRDRLEEKQKWKNGPGRGGFQGK